ncbi:hypothetical protein TcasGA2_TC001795 [Tribolium castaneum]|uniref:Uncharacterized protein n=1 Tax=Tribolium castaneum TaxID=7070 RepID=D7EKV4_TRICA|nr:hypothetical protein TcasGA2_TC001795 [Tribolium castaneum]
MFGFNRNTAYFVLMFLPIVLAQPAGYYGDYDMNLVHNYAGLADDTVDHILTQPAGYFGDYNMNLVHNHAGLADEVVDRILDRIPAGTFDSLNRIDIHWWPGPPP